MLFRIELADQKVMFARTCKNKISAKIWAIQKGIELNLPVTKVKQVTR